MPKNSEERNQAGGAFDANGQPYRPAMPQDPRAMAAGGRRQAGQGIPQSAYSRVTQAPVQQGAYVPASYGAASQYSRNSGSYAGRGKGGSRGKKILVALIVIALIAAVAGLAFYVVKETRKSEINNDFHNLSKDEMQAVDNELTGTTTFDAPFTVLLLGSDERTDDPDMGARTDTVILCRVDPVKNIISMMSIPRDTMIDLDGVGRTKFNSAYTYGGPSGTIAAVKNLTGVDIDHYAEINFEGLVDLIDAVGGIDVTVDERIDDPNAGPVVIEEGEQHLDGEAALTFARSRAYVDGDYSRQKNQRKVIDAIIHKGLETPATELAGIIQASTKFLTTDSAMDFDFIFSLADQIRHNHDYPLTFYSANIPSAPSTIDGVSYVVADTAGVSEMARVFLEGGDISTVGTASIDSDIAAAGGGTGSESAPAIVDEGTVSNTYYYEETYYDDTYYGEVYYDDSDGGDAAVVVDDGAGAGDMGGGGLGGDMGGGDMVDMGDMGGGDAGGDAGDM